MPWQLDRLNSPLGTILLVTDDAAAVRSLDFADHEPRLHRLLRIHYGEVPLQAGPAPAEVRQALDDWFAGDLAALDSLQVTTGGTAFQQDVWRLLRVVPAGTTRTYGQLAAQLGRPSASRAVGAANGANPVSIIVPCHRVVGANGDLTGYAGGVLRKRWLLDHEQAWTSQVSRSLFPHPSLLTHPVQ